MKRLLLAPLLLTLLFGCSSKDNGIINLECSFDSWRASNFPKGSYQPIEAYWLNSDIKINEKDKKVSIIYKDNKGMKEKKIEDNILITNSLIKFEHSHFIDYGIDYKYEINRINGEIDLLLDFQSHEGYAKFKGKCFVPEDLKTLF